MVALYARRIQADPLDASAYASRAAYHDSLHNKAEANADMRQWSAALVEDCPGIHPLARRGDSGARSMARLDISSPSLSEGGTMGFQFYVLPSGRKVGVR